MQKCRIEAALILLKQTDKQIEEIAGQVGYKDLKTFQKIFKDMTGVTPSKYRKEGRR